MPHAKQSDPLGRIVVADLRGQCCFVCIVAGICGEIFRVLFWAPFFCSEVFTCLVLLCDYIDIENDHSLLPCRNHCNDPESVAKCFDNL